MTGKTSIIGLLGCSLLALGCWSPAAQDPPPAQPAPAARFEGPIVRVVGTVQDGGLPHASCYCVRCQAARSDDSRRRRVASLAILHPEPRRVFLIDATPDIRRQLDDVADWKGFAEGRVDRTPLDGVLLTHAHIGHYTGLAFFGFEAIHARELPVFCSRSMSEFLVGNGPWNQLVELGNISPARIVPGKSFDLAPDVSVLPLAVPHRQEYTDTLGFVIRGPRRTVLYVPDTDSWRAWDPPLTAFLDDVDVAILDGTFYSGQELPGRSVDSIGHPLITESMDLLQSWTERIEIYFTHLNHSNPALDPAAPESNEIDRRGFAILDEGREIPI